MVSLTECHLFSETGPDSESGRWRFVLRRGDGLPPLEAGDVEPDVRGERLELLSVVRGLEAIEEPSRVVLVTSSVYVREGIRYGLDEWRKNDWQWESFGEMAPVKNRDLWQRVDRALRFHQIECRTWRIDSAHTAAPAPHANKWSEQAAIGRVRPKLLASLRPRLESLGRKVIERVACL
jgi:ribonuclease HI